MATIKECTNMMLNEIAPYIDEMLAVEFAEIDEAIEEGLISLDEATKIKKKKMSALSKALLGTAALGVGGVAGRFGGKALSGVAAKMAKKAGTAKGSARTVGKIANVLQTPYRLLKRGYGKASQYIAGGAQRAEDAKLIKRVKGSKPSGKAYLRQAPSNPNPNEMSAADAKALAAWERRQAVRKSARKAGIQ